MHVLLIISSFKKPEERKKQNWSKIIKKWKYCKLDIFIYNIKGKFKPSNSGALKSEDKNVHGKPRRQIKPYLWDVYYCNEMFF